MLAFTKFKKRKVVKSCKSSIKGSLKVGFQLLFLSSYLLKGVSSSKRNMKGTYHQLFNFLSQLLKAKKGAKGCWKEITFFLMWEKLYPSNGENPWLYNLKFFLNPSKLLYFVVFKGPVQSSLLTFFGQDQDQDQSLWLLKLQKTRPDQQELVQGSLMQSYAVVQPVSTSYSHNWSPTG